ncbi:MAG: nickel-dependent hydrogenase large subunit [Campylobacterales bacterium]|nr:nickel-dependent hydrogenase large subunit [Campylobacterales bacterium]
MIKKDIIEKIEGEADVVFTKKNGVVDDIDLIFPYSRGIESILEGREYRDALVIAPRVCGICSHSHLIAAVNAIEDGFRKANIAFELTEKARCIRDFALSCELIQNHIKWLYLVILPELYKINRLEIPGDLIKKASKITYAITKAMAIFTGQWPHASYVVAGGVSCDPSYVEVLQAKALVDEVLEYMHEALFNPKEMSILKDMESVFTLLEKADILSLCMHTENFLALGDTFFSRSGVYKEGILSKIDIEKIEEITRYESKAKDVLYDHEFVEVGPLARALINQDEIVNGIYKEYKSGIWSRIFARIFEGYTLTLKAKEILECMDVSQQSCVLSHHKKSLSFSGIGIVEAARGSLVHEIVIKENRIDTYNIITPSQWNLSRGSVNKKGVARQAVRGARSKEEAYLILRSFDLCSVCTTQ